MNTIKEYDIVALNENIQATHKQTHQPILLRKGQVGTVLMEFGGEAYLVDFADDRGVTYAMETVAGDKLIPLIYTLIESEVTV
jgi:hypothetical protein